MDNELSTYSQFFEVVNRVENFVPTAKSVFVKATSCLDFAISHCDMQEKKLKKSISYSDKSSSYIQQITTHQTTVLP